jgi:hypothetical protein
VKIGVTHLNGSGATSSGSWEIRKRTRFWGYAGVAVELHKEMPGRRKDEVNIQPLECSVELGLLQAVSGWKALSLGLDECHGDRLSLWVDLDAQGVIHPAFGLLARLAVDDLGGPSGGGRRS